jgi:transcriptional regulator with XRE-family HTH domain
MDRAQLADFLRTRREALQPEDVGTVRGARRRTRGLRREEVAMLAGMSTDYYSRLEQQRGPQPSTQILAALARALRLAVPERDHLFRLAGHAAPDRLPTIDHVGPGIQRILDRLTDTPAQVVTATGETLVQNPLAVALLGDQTSYSGLARSTVYRWYTDPASRDVYPADDHPLRGRIFTAELRAAAAAGGPGSRAAQIVAALTRESAEFREVWAAHDVDEKHAQTKRFRHREIGDLTLECETLLDTETGQRLLVFTARAGSADADKLALLGVVGTQRLS